MIAEQIFKCKYCGHIGQIYPMHYCDSIKEMRDIEGKLGESIIPLNDSERKRYYPSLSQKVKSFLKQIL